MSEVDASRPTAFGENRLVMLSVRFLQAAQYDHSSESIFFNTPTNYSCIVGAFTNIEKHIHKQQDSEQHRSAFVFRTASLYFA